jgi:pyruvate/2-oxoglutarate/acetoin dehydrogenase E1 component
MTDERILSFGDAVREGLQEATEHDERVFLMGEGVADPSSMWGTTKDVLAGDPNRVVEMPIAENGMFGVAVGAALCGQRPVINLQRVEFSLLAIEQLVNNAAKAHYVSRGAHRVPLVVRMVIGRGWGQGPEHSQSLEAVFANFPGLKVVMPSFAVDAKCLLLGAVADDNPVVILEHRWLHNVTGHVPLGYCPLPLDGPRVVRAGTDVTVVATSLMTIEAMLAARYLEEVGCSVEVVDLRVVRPLLLDVVLDSVARTGRLITVDTGFQQFGVGAEIVATVAGEQFSSLVAPPLRLGLPPHPTPSSRGLVPGFYPDALQIADAVAVMLSLDEGKRRTVQDLLADHRGDLPIDVPDPSFRGPF